MENLESLSTFVSLILGLGVANALAQFARLVKLGDTLPKGRDHFIDLGPTCPIVTAAVVAGNIAGAFTRSPRSHAVCVVIVHTTLVAGITNARVTVYRPAAGRRARGGSRRCTAVLLRARSFFRTRRELP